MSTSENTNIGTVTPPLRQLQMLWPADKLTVAPEVKLPPGYELRRLKDGEEEAYFALMQAAGFKEWGWAMLKDWQRRILPGGVYVIEHLATGKLVATTMATHNPSDQHPYGGELGWVAADPGHLGKRLGEAACAAVIRHYLRCGYTRIYLKTDDFRLAAIKTYLRMGFEPLIDDDTMPGRWTAVHEKLGLVVGR